MTTTTRAVDDVLKRAFAKDPSARFLTCGEFADALVAASGEPLDPRALRAFVDAISEERKPTVIAAVPTF